MLEQEASKTAIDPMNAMILLKLKFSLFSLTQPYPAGPELHRR